MLQVSSARLGQGGCGGSKGAGRRSGLFSRVIAQAGEVFDGLLGVGFGFKSASNARAQALCSDFLAIDMLTCAWLCRAGSVLAAAQG